MNGVFLILFVLSQGQWLPAKDKTPFKLAITKKECMKIAEPYNDVARVKGLMLKCVKTKDIDALLAAYEKRR